MQSQLQAIHLQRELMQRCCYFAVNHVAFSIHRSREWQCPTAVKDAASVKNTHNLKAPNTRRVLAYVAVEACNTTTLGRASTRFEIDFVACGRVTWIQHSFVVRILEWAIVLATAAAAAVAAVAVVPTTATTTAIAAAIVVTVVAVVKVV